MSTYETTEEIEISTNSNDIVTDTDNNLVYVAQGVITVINGSTNELDRTIFGLCNGTNIYSSINASINACT